MDLVLDEMFGEHIVIALAGRPSDCIVVFTDQMFRIWEGPIQRELPSADAKREAGHSLGDPLDDVDL
jgi:hypothetical protein